MDYIYMWGFHEYIWIGWEIALIDQQSSNLEVGIEYISWFKASSHMSQKLCPWNCESPKEVSKGCPKTIPKPCTIEPL
jgi:hypothetical protein